MKKYLPILKNSPFFKGLTDNEILSCLLYTSKGEYDSVSDEMGSIYYKGFSEEEITRFEECLDRIRKNREEWQKS